MEYRLFAEDVAPNRSSVVSQEHDAQEMPTTSTIGKLRVTGNVVSLEEPQKDTEYTARIPQTDNCRSWTTPPVVAAIDCFEGLRSRLPLHRIASPHHQPI